MVRYGRINRGLIPAHAGKTLEVWMNGIKGRAHPRSRGENLGGAGFGVRVAGSSPLTRGKPSPPYSHSLGGGLIPAHAGKTRLEPSRGQSRGAHPRSRGEN